MSDSLVARGLTWLRTNRWFVAPVGAHLAIVAVYLATHECPVGIGGLHGVMADSVSGLDVPDSVPYYTADGIRFAYPPLIFIVAGALMDFGIEYLSLATYLPAVFSTALIIPSYYFGVELLDSRERAGVAAIIIAVAPTVFKTQLRE